MSDLITEDSPFDSRFLDAICEALAGFEDKKAPYEYKTGSETYSEDAAAISWQVTPDLDRTISVAAYPVEDDPSISDTTYGIQFRIVGPIDLDFANCAKSDLLDLFHGLRRTTMGTVTVIQAFRRSGANLGQNGQGQAIFTENYYFTVHRPSKNRT